MNGDEFDVAQCLRRVREQDLEAARVLVERLYPQIIRIVRSHLPARAAEEDLAQEIFAKLFARLDQYEQRRGVPFTHWVSRLAVRTCLDALRAERRRPELRWADLPDEQAEWLQFMLADETPPPEASPTSARELLEKLLAQLPPADRLILHALDLEERPVKEVAALTGWSVTLVKVRAFRARRKLRKLALVFKENHPYETL
ncbi:MAG: sigma-70 family RNA polymerase sigma factor [Verrucomicrobia bacterium]|nr:sigma-70 family RNA polymerase sigma factor [Verrucomicrobiota bacterium]